MTDNQITVFMEKFGGQISDAGSVRQSMRNADEGCMDGLMSLKLKKKSTAFLLSFFLGGFGAGRFYLGDKPSRTIGILRIIASVLTGALSFVKILGAIVSVASAIWIIVEWFLCYKHTNKVNDDIICEYLSAHPKKAV